MWFAFGSKAKLLLEFKDKFPFMSDADILERYQSIMNTPILTKRKTDLNNACLEYILKSVGDNKNVLDVGCGTGYLLNEIASQNPDVQCHGADFILRTNMTTTQEKSLRLFAMHEVDITRSMPFPDHSFDMVLCTQTLEHLRNPQEVLKELIRVTKRRLIIVVPRQREYLYTIDNHVNFFPYMYSFKRFIGIENAVYLNLKGDFLCRIDFD